MFFGACAPVNSSYVSRVRLYFDVFFTMFSTWRLVSSFILLPSESQFPHFFCCTYAWVTVCLEDRTSSCEVRFILYKSPRLRTSWRTRSRVTGSRPVFGTACVWHPHYSLSDKWLIERSTPSHSLLYMNPLTVGVWPCIARVLWETVGLGTGRNTYCFERL